MSQKDKQLPFTWHIVSLIQHIDLIEDLILIVFMRTQEVVVGDPERQVVVGTFVIIEAVSWRGKRLCRCG